MAASYPNSIASLTNPSASTTQDTSGVEHDVVETKQNEEVVAVETELGTNPKSIDDTVTVSATPTSVANFLDMVARRLKDIIGTSWTTAVTRTLNALNTLFETEHSQAGAHTTDTISEKTAAAGVTVDGVLIKDNTILERYLKLDEIQRAVIAAEISTVSTTAVDMTGLTVTFTPAVASNILIIVSLAAENTTASSAAYSILYDGGALDPPGGIGWRFNLGTPNLNEGAWIAWKTGVTAAAHTIKMQWKTSAGTLYCNRAELLVIPFASA